MRSIYVFATSRLDCISLSMLGSFTLSMAASASEALVLRSLTYSAEVAAGIEIKSSCITASSGILAVARCAVSVLDVLYDEQIVFHSHGCKSIHLLHLAILVYADYSPRTRSDSAEHIVCAGLEGLLVYVYHNGAQSYLAYRHDCLGVGEGREDYLVAVSPPVDMPVCAEYEAQSTRARLADDAMSDSQMVGKRFFKIIYLRMELVLAARYDIHQTSRHSGFVLLVDTLQVYVWYMRRIVVS